MAAGASIYAATREELDAKIEAFRAALNAELGADVDAAIAARTTPIYGALDLRHPEFSAVANSAEPANGTPQLLTRLKIFADAQRHMAPFGEGLRAPTVAITGVGISYLKKKRRGHLEFGVTPENCNFDIRCSAFHAENTELGKAIDTIYKGLELSTLIGRFKLGQNDVLEFEVDAILPMDQTLGQTDFEQAGIFNMVGLGKLQQQDKRVG